MPAANTMEDIISRMTGPQSGCWTGVGSIDTSTGYAVIGISGERWYVHRLSYTHSNGAIPPGHTIDHLCHNRSRNCPGGKYCFHRRCFNPAHLEAVTSTENKRRGKSLPAQNARKMNCPCGLSYTEDSRGHRRCEPCRRVGRQRIGEISALGRKVDRTHCPQNHEYTGENTYIDKEGSRHCRACSRDRAQARRDAKCGTEF